MKFIVAIDGPSASGKSTIAKQLSEKLGIVYVDSGAMYRGITYYFLMHKIDIRHDDHVAACLSKLDFKYGAYGIILDGLPIADEVLRTPDVTANVSKVSANEKVRDYLVQIQRKLSIDTSLVMDGRDIGTNVFPNATFKFFLVADAAVRANRRFLELKKTEPRLSFETVLAEIQKRDKADSERALHPLKKAPDAFEIDTSHLEVHEVIEMILKRIEKNGDYFGQSNGVL